MITSWNILAGERCSTKDKEQEYIYKTRTRTLPSRKSLFYFVEIWSTFRLDLNRTSTWINCIIILLQYLLSSLHKVNRMNAQCKSLRASVFLKISYPKPLRGFRFEAFTENESAKTSSGDRSAMSLFGRSALMMEAEEISESLVFNSA